MRVRLLTSIGVLAGFCAWAGEALSVIAIDPFYAPSYTFTDLGSAPGLPFPYGGLTFKAGDTSKILIGGNANTAAGLLYEVSVVRDAGGHITGFSGLASAFGTVGAFNDGGVVYGPGGVLFTSQWPVNMLGQTKPGSTAADKVIDLGALGVASSHSALNFVPTGFSGAGNMKLVYWSGGQWYDGVLTPDGFGTFDLGITPVDLDLVASGIQNLPGGPEGFVYISGANPIFTANSLLVSEFSANKVASYEIDSSGNPILSTRRTFVDGLTGAEGAVIDPVTGDFLFSTFGDAVDRIIVVQGFTVLPPPPPPIPEPETYALMLAGLGLLGFAARRRKQKDAA